MPEGPGVPEGPGFPGAPGRPPGSRAPHDLQIAHSAQCHRPGSFEKNILCIEVYCIQFISVKKLMRTLE